MYLGQAGNTHARDKNCDYILARMEVSDSLSVGTVVQLHSLSTARLNGRRGTLLSGVDAESGRYAVLLFGKINGKRKTIAVRPRNIRTPAALPEPVVQAIPALSADLKLYCRMSINPCCGTCEKMPPASQPWMRCGRCKSVYFCSRTCQKLGWPEHKKVCKRLARGKEEAKAMGVASAAALAECRASWSPGAVLKEIPVHKRLTAVQLSTLQKGRPALPPITLEVSRHALRSCCTPDTPNCH